jgi:hypothetical protein
MKFLDENREKAIMKKVTALASGADHATIELFQN